MKYITFNVIFSHTGKLKQYRLSYTKAMGGLISALVLFVITLFVIWNYTNQIQRKEQQLQIKKQVVLQEFELQRMNVAIVEKKREITDTSKLLYRLQTLHNLQADWLKNSPKVEVKYTGKSFDQLKTIKNNVKILEINLFREQTLMQENRFRLRRTPSIRVVSGGRISSPFGMRTDPFTLKQHMHEGLDFAVPLGTPIYAPADGRVVMAGINGAYGRMVIIDHGYNIVTRYGHMSGFNVQVGDFVHRYDVIGYVGSTGRSTGNHVHYEVRLNDQAVNPMNYIVKKRN